MSNRYNMNKVGYFGYHQRQLFETNTIQVCGVLRVFNKGIIYLCIRSIEHFRFA